jgi:hypothetical protein
MILYVSIYLSKTTFQSPHDKILVFEKVNTMNVRGLFSNSKKRADVFDWAKSKHASIVCFQEMHSNNNIEKYWEDKRKAVL